MWRKKMQVSNWPSLSTRGRNGVRRWYRNLRREGKSVYEAREMCWALMHGVTMSCLWEEGRS